MGDVAQLFEVSSLACNKCKLSLPVSEFNKNSSKKRGYAYTCRKCIDYKSQYASWRDKNCPDRLRRGSDEHNKYLGAISQQRHSKLRQIKLQRIQETGMITCARCKLDKSPTDFCKDRKRPTGHRAQCKACSAAYYADKCLKYYHANKEKMSTKASWYRKKSEFGVTKEDYYRMLAEQAGSCAICKRSDNKGKLFHIDHNHDTGKVRGLLCKNCNNGIGMLGDNITIIKNAAIYLESRGSYGKA